MDISSFVKCMLMISYLDDQIVAQAQDVDAPQPPPQVVDRKNSPLGVESGIFISQEKYTKDLLKRFKMDECKPIKTPMPLYDW